MADEAQLRRQEDVLVRAVDALEQAGIPYALMGGLAAASIGRERSTKDVDVFITPDHAEAALEALGQAGFRTERTDPSWLYKAFWEECLVDLIFESSGGILFDEEVRAHRREVTVLGREIMALAAEDILLKSMPTDLKPQRPRTTREGKTT